MNEIAALFTSFSHLQNMAKALLKLRDFEKLNATVIELQNEIMTAQSQAIGMQQSHAALEAKARDLEAECMRLKDWSAEKKNYACRAIAVGVFAYMQKKVVDDFQDAHKYCCNCFDQGQKSLLQQTSKSDFTVILTCPRCRFIVGFDRYLPGPKRALRKK